MRAAVLALLERWRSEVAQPFVSAGGVVVKNRRMQRVPFAGGRLSMEVESIEAACELLADALATDALNEAAELQESQPASAWPDVLGAFTRAQLFSLRSEVNRRLDTQEHA